MGSDERRMGMVTATGLVVASMVGVGVFTTTGLLVDLIPSPRVILLCWLVAGAAAWCGATAYAELGAALPHSGGEYHYLSRLMHPAVGFTSAFVSLVVGFAVPLAALALAFGSYLAAVVPGAPERLSGALLIVGLSALHMVRVSTGARFQDAFTIAKIVLIAAFILCGAFASDVTLLAATSAPKKMGWSSGFAVGLMEVTFAYTGWNAASYVAGEVREPGKTLPRALLIGTALVTAVYVLLNAVFLASAPMSELSRRVDVAYPAAVRLVGDKAARAVSALIGFGLVSTVGAMVVTGPRIYEAVGRDFPRLRVLTRRGARGGPVVAIALQAAIALVMMFVSGFEALLWYIGFTLSIFSALTVASVFILRHRAIASPYRMPGYPVTPVLFLLLMAWIVFEGLRNTPGAALAGVATVALGLGIYVFAKD